MDWLFGFFGGIFSSWIFLLGVFFFAILAENKDRLGWSVFLGILTAVSLYLVVGLSSLTGLSWWALALIYLAGGITHSFWRWFRYTSLVTDRYNEASTGEPFEGRVLNASTLRSYTMETDYRENLDKITYWIIAWPISGSAHFLGDVVTSIQKMVTKWFSGVFDSITARARSKATFKVSELD